VGTEDRGGAKTSRGIEEGGKVNSNPHWAALYFCRGPKHRGNAMRIQARRLGEKGERRFPIVLRGEGFAGRKAMSSSSFCADRESAGGVHREKEQAFSHGKETLY